MDGPQSRHRNVSTVLVLEDYHRKEECSWLVYRGLLPDNSSPWPTYISDNADFQNHDNKMNSTGIWTCGSGIVESTLSLFCTVAAGRLCGLPHEVVDRTVFMLRCSPRGVLTSAVGCRLCHCCWPCALAFWTAFSCFGIFNGMLIRLTRSSFGFGSWRVESRRVYPPE